MPVRSPKLILVLTASTLALAACGQKADEAAPPASSQEVASAGAGATRDAAGPVIDRAIAPGVAFSFDYAFILPAKAISSVQRDHAAACAKLGANRCRVTGVSYDQPYEGEVSARMDFLLAPDLAQAFASDGIAAVESAEGTLDKASVAGENAGGQIMLSQQDSAAVEAEIKRIEARLVAKGLTGDERAELQQQLGALREQLRGNSQQRRNLEQSIATTPVKFTYASESILAGKGTFAKAAGASLTSMGALASFLLLLAGTFGPWVGLIAAIWFGWTRLRRKGLPAEPAVHG